MAAKFRKVDPRIWHDERFRRLTGEDKLLAIYLLTCSQANRIGLFHVSIAMAAESVGRLSDTHPIPMGGVYASVVHGIQRVCDTLRWKFDEASSTLFLPSWWKYNRDPGPRALKGFLSDLHDVPQTPLFEEFAANNRYLSDTESKVLREVCDTYRGGIRDSAAVAVAVERAVEGEKERTVEVEIPPNPPSGGNPDSHKPSGKPQKQIDAEAVAALPVPECLHSPEFFEAWESFQKFRIEKKSQLTVIGAQRTLSKLAKESIPAAVDRLNRSMENGWIGLWFASDGKNGQRPGPKTETEKMIDAANQFLNGDLP